MKSSAAKSAIAVAVFLFLVAVGFAGRFAFLETPNFTLTGAVALFAGYYFQRRAVALLVPIAVLALSNLWLPDYNAPGVVVVVYAALLLPVMLGSLARRQPSLARIATAALAPSLVFYLSTNLAVWAFTNEYPRTAAGLLECYYYALPFYRWMLEADIAFSLILFGGYAAARHLAVRHAADWSAASGRHPASPPARLAEARA